MEMNQAEIMNLIEAGLKRSDKFASFVYTHSFDSNQNAVLTVSADSTPAHGEKVAVFRVSPNALRLSGNAVFTGAANLAVPQSRPNLIELAIEAASGGPITRAELAELVECSSKLGTTLRIYEESSGTVPSTSSMVASKLIDEIRGNRFNSGISQ